MPSLPRMLWALLVIASLWPMTCWAQQKTTAVYDDWTVLCDLPANGAKSCEVAHQVVAPDTDGVLAQITIGQSAGNAPIEIKVQTPANVFLPPGVTFNCNKQIEFSATFVWCVPTRCLAVSNANDEALANLRANTEACKIQYTRANKEIATVPIPVKGLSQALDARGK